jgi:hypothetical protein
MDLEVLLWLRKQKQIREQQFQAIQLLLGMLQLLLHQVMRLR